MTNTRKRNRDTDDDPNNLYTNYYDDPNNSYTNNNYDLTTSIHNIICSQHCPETFTDLDYHDSPNRRTRIFADLGYDNDEIEIEREFMKDINTGCTEAMRNYSIYLFTNNKENFPEYLLKVIDKDDIIAMRYLGKFYYYNYWYNNKYEIKTIYPKPDDEKWEPEQEDNLRKYLGMGSERGDGESSYLLSKYYLGLNNEKHKKYRQKALDQGFLKSNYLIGKCYYDDGEYMDCINSCKDNTDLDSYSLLVKCHNILGNKRECIKYIKLIYGNPILDVLRDDDDKHHFLNNIDTNLFDDIDLHLRIFSIGEFLTREDCLYFLTHVSIDYTSEHMCQNIFRRALSFNIDIKKYLICQISTQKKECDICTETTELFRLCCNHEICPKCLVNSQPRECRHCRIEVFNVIMSTFWR